jgi:hypothetical protein
MGKIESARFALKLREGTDEEGRYTQKLNKLLQEKAEKKSDKKFEELQKEIASLKEQLNRQS